MPKDPVARGERPHTPPYTLPAGSGGGGERVPAWAHGQPEAEPFLRDVARGKNRRFYSNMLESTPNGARIDTIHRDWAGNFQLLERHHGFIQWLFPLRADAGVNWSAQRLDVREAEWIRSDMAASRRVVRSYELMLEFYGLRLVDVSTGAVECTAAWRARFHNLQTRRHNFLRVSRIIQSLGQLGFARYKAPLVRVLREHVEKGNLSACKRSLREFWAPLAADDSLDAPESVFFSTTQAAAATTQTTTAPE